MRKITILFMFLLAGVSYGTITYQDFDPNTTNKFELGNANKRWKTVYAVDVNSTGDLYIGDDGFFGGDASAKNFVAAVSTADGTQPYACNSTTLNTNLNADILDGYHYTQFQTAGNYVVTGSAAQFADVNLPTGGEFTVNGVAIGGGDVNDTAYGASWNGKTTIAPSQNAVYDQLETIKAAVSAAVDDTAYGASWDGVTTVSSSKNAIYDQLETIKATVIPQDITAGRVSFNTELGETTLPTFLVVNAQTGSTFALDTTNVRGGRWKSTTGNKDAICSIDSKYKYFLGSDTPAIESSFTPLETIPNDVQYGIGFWAANHVFAGSANCAVICARYGGNVALVSVDNAGNVEVTGSSIALPAANVAMHLKVVLYANKVEAYVNGVLVMTNSTRVPSSSVALYASIGAIRLNVPGTVGNADWDYYLASQTRQ